MVFKKIISIILVISLMLSLFGCAKAPNSEAVSSSEEVKDDLAVTSTSTVEKEEIEKPLKVKEIDMDKYDGVVLEKTTKASSSYMEETVFVGDSNTARLYSYGKTSFDQTIGVVSMSVQGAVSEGRIWFYGYDQGYTIPQAVGMINPRRIVLNYGTNNAGGSKTEDFITIYDTLIDNIQKAAPGTDIIISAVPPVSKKADNAEKMMEATISFNEALLELAKEKELTFLNTSEVLQDKYTGYALDGMIENDGIHLTEKALTTVVDYFNTHTHIVPDTRKNIGQTPAHMPEPEPEEEKAPEGDDLEELDPTELAKLDTVSVIYNVQIEGGEPMNEDGTSAFTGGMTGPALCVRGGSAPLTILAAGGYGYFVSVTPGCEMQGDTLVVSQGYVGDSVEVIITYYLA